MISTIPLLLRNLGPRAGDDERGASLLEYVLLLSFIAIMLIAAVTVFGGSLGSAFNESGSSLDAVP